MKTYTIACEGPTCNAGHSALDREAAILHGLPNVNAANRDDAEKHARSETSKRLAVTAHHRAGITTRAAVVLELYACNACGHERVYGNRA